MTKLLDLGESVIQLSVRIFFQREPDKNNNNSFTKILYKINILIKIKETFKKPERRVLYFSFIQVKISCLNKLRSKTGRKFLFVLNIWNRTNYYRTCLKTVNGERHRKKRRQTGTLRYTKKTNI